MRVTADTVRKIRGPGQITLDAAEHELRAVEAMLAREEGGRMAFFGSYSTRVFDRYRDALAAHWAGKGEV